GDRRIGFTCTRSTLCRTCSPKSTVNARWGAATNKIGVPHTEVGSQWPSRAHRETASYPPVKYLHVHHKPTNRARMSSRTSTTRAGWPPRDIQPPQTKRG